MSRLTPYIEHPEDLSPKEAAAVAELEESFGISANDRTTRFEFDGGKGIQFFVIKGFGYKGSKYCAILMETDRGGAVSLATREEKWPVDYVAEMLAGRSELGGILKKI